MQTLLPQTPSSISANPSSLPQHEWYLQAFEWDRFEPRLGEFVLVQHGTKPPSALLANAQLISVAPQVRDIVQSLLAELHTCPDAYLSAAACMPLLLQALSVVPGHTRRSLSETSLPAVVQ